MTANLLIGLPTMALGLLVQAALFAYTIRRYGRHQRSRTRVPTFWSSFVIITAVMVLLVLGTVLQVAIALAAIALLTRKKWLEYGMFGMAGVGVLVGVLAIFHI